MKDAEGRVYFVDHNTRTTTWLDPRTKPETAASSNGRSVHSNQQSPVQTAPAPQSKPKPRGTSTYEGLGRIGNVPATESFSMSQYDQESSTDDPSLTIGLPSSGILDTNTFADTSMYARSLSEAEESDLELPPSPTGFSDAGSESQSTFSANTASMEPFQPSRKYYAPLVAPDDSTPLCTHCNTKFGVLRRRVSGTVSLCCGDCRGP